MLRSKAANGSWKRAEILSGLDLDALWQIPQDQFSQRSECKSLPRHQTAWLRQMQSVAQRWRVAAASRRRHCCFARPNLAAAIAHRLKSIAV